MLSHIGGRTLLFILCLSISFSASIHHALPQAPPSCSSPSLLPPRSLNLSGVYQPKPFKLKVMKDPSSAAYVAGSSSDNPLLASFTLDCAQFCVLDDVVTTLSALFLTVSPRFVLHGLCVAGFE